MVQQSNADFQASVGRIYGKISFICSLILLIMLIIYGMYLITNPYKPTDKDYKNNIIYTHSRIVGIFIVLLSSFFVYLVVMPVKNLLIEYLHRELHHYLNNQILNF